MATKEHRRFARGLIEELESRVHGGPPIGATEIVSAHEFLRQSNFSPESDYFSRLSHIQTRLATRPRPSSAPHQKRNYGGEAGGRWMQVQSIHDHVILSTCYAGEFNLRRGRVKISHRFNSEGRIDFVELKFLRALLACLNGETRKLVTIKNYQNIRKDWHEADGFTLRVLPQESIFLYPEIFRCPKSEVLAWLINIGHGMLGALMSDLNGALRRTSSQAEEPGEQLPLDALGADDVALPILRKAAALESVVELADESTLVVRYHRV